MSYVKQRRYAAGETFPSVMEKMSMRRAPVTLVLLAAVICFGGCNCGTDEPKEACETHEDCQDSAAPHCNTDDGECVECLSNDHCEGNFVCSDFVCQEPLTCSSDEDCTQPGHEHCETEAGVCVECMDDDHCDVEAGERCLDFSCVDGSVECQHEGFSAVEEESFYIETVFGPLLAYIGASDTALPLDELWVSWWFDYGASFEGPGTYAIEANSNIASCGLCVWLERLDADEETTQFFFAVEGEVEITAASADGLPFDGVLRDAVFVEWDLEADEPLAGGEGWCVYEHSWETILDGDLPPLSCSSDNDCTDPNLPHCEPSRGVCAECSRNDHCDQGEGEECLSGICRVPGACYHEGFEAQLDESYYEIDDGGRVLTYLAANDQYLPLDLLWVSWWFDYGVEWHGVGTYSIESDTDMRDCGLCVYIVELDAQGSFSRLFFATEGEIEIADIGVDGEPFDGIIRDLVLVEWNLESDTAVHNGEIWCIEEHSFATVLEGNPPCLHDDGCTDPEAPLCNLDTGFCVECLEDGDCAFPMVCARGHCIILCDESGFDAALQSSEYVDGDEGPILRYVGESNEDMPLDELSVSWVFDRDANYMAAGLYGLQPDATPEDCGLCVTLTRLDANEEVVGLYFGLGGTIEITEVGGDGEAFEGVLHDVSLVEWDIEANAPLEDGSTWCIDGHEWTTILDGPLPEFFCEGDHHCTSPGREYCDIDSGACAPCVLDDHCGEWAACEGFVCVYACHETGFSATTHLTSYQEDGDLLRYTGLSGDQDERDELDIEWWGDFGAPFQGVGIYPIEEDSNYATCGLCVTILRYDSDGDIVGYFFAIDGEIEVTEVDLENGSFQGRVHDLVLIEWDGATDAAADGAQSWCIDDYSWDTALPEDMPPPLSCQVDANCADPAVPHCDTSLGICVACLQDSHCDEAGGEECILGGCIIPSCDHDGFTAVNETIEFIPEWDVLFYTGSNSEAEPFDLIDVEWYFGVDLLELGPGTYEIGSDLDGNYATCSTCVLIRQGCDTETGCVKTFYAFDGILEIDEIGPDGSDFAATLLDARFMEVTIGGDFISWPVSGGEMWCLDNHSLSATMQGSPPTP